jgi:hypothetical protein
LRFWRREPRCARGESSFGRAELATEQIYASALSARRRAAVMAMDFAVPRK